MTDETEIERLMEGAKTVLGTCGYFACIPRLQAWATTGYNKTPALAIAELRNNIRNKLALILKKEKKLNTQPA